SVSPRFRGDLFDVVAVGSEPPEETPRRPRAPAHRGDVKAARVALVVNPHARMHARDRGLLDRMHSIARGRASVHVTQSLVEMWAMARELAAADTELVLLSGGDGTLMAGVSALAAAYGDDRLPAVMPIPGGTAGTVARNWRIDGRPDRWLARVLSGGRRFEDKPSLGVRRGDQGRIGFIFGTGLVASFFRLYYERGAPGYRGSAALVSRIFLESFVGGPLARRVLEPLPCRLEVDGRTMTPPAWSLICSAVVKNLGLHMM